MRILKTITRWICALFYIAAGINHFVNPEFYIRIMPPYLPWHSELVFISGVAELVLGLLLLIPKYSRWAAWGIIALLIAVFPANIYVFQNHEAIFPTPEGGNPDLAHWVHFIRLPLQGVLILWAYWYTRPDKRASTA